MDTQENRSETSHEVPLHRRIAETLSNQIRSGKLKPGDNLPSERQIARQFSASRATVRTALQRLEQAGLITRRERRSAVVKIRRDLTPHLRIAASNFRVIRLMRRLADLQLLPPRCQMYLADLQQSETLGQLVTQPALGADALVCEIEYAGMFHNGDEMEPPALANMVAGPYSYLCRRGKLGSIVPIGVSPLVIYFNRAVLAETGLPEPGQGWGWDQLRETARHLTRGRRYGLQFRPTFSHLSALASSLGGTLYREDGKAAVGTEPFEGTLRLVHDLVHGEKVTPLVAKSDPVNLFADGRCGLAIDGYGMYTTYRDTLGEALGVAPMPRTGSGRPALTGLAMAILGEPVDPQATGDLTRTMLSASVQQALVRTGGALPVRGDLHEPEILRDLQVPHETLELWLSELQACRPMPLPADPTYKQQFETLVLELWLGMDSLDGIRERMHQLT